VLGGWCRARGHTVPWPSWPVKSDAGFADRDRAAQRRHLEGMTDTHTDTMRPLYNDYCKSYLKCIQDSLKSTIGVRRIRLMLLKRGNFYGVPMTWMYSRCAGHTVDRRANWLVAWFRLDPSRAAACEASHRSSIKASYATSPQIYSWKTTIQLTRGVDISIGASGYQPLSASCRSRTDRTIWVTERCADEICAW